jgi:hypothetical protein
LPKRQAPDSGTDAAAVPAAATPTWNIRFQHDNVGTMVLSEVIGATETGVASANDHDICLTIAFQGTAVFGIRAGCGRPIAVRQR